MIIQSVSSFKVNNSRNKQPNYSKDNNYKSKINSYNQDTDSFHKSSNPNKILFKGAPATLIKTVEPLSKLNGIARRLGEEATEVISTVNVKLKGTNKLPQNSKLSKPKTLNYGIYSTSVRDDIIRWNRTHNDHLLDVPSTNETQAGARPYEEELNRAISKYDDSFYTTYKKNSFKGTIDSDIGEPARSAASEVAKEVVGEGAFQAAERALDCVLPGAGAAITAFRWGRKIYKSNK